MTDRRPKSDIHLRLDQNLALGADDLQWILYKAARIGVPIDAPLVSKDWKAVSFVRSTKAILLRCVEEKGGSLEAQKALKGYPRHLRGLEKVSRSLKTARRANPGLITQPASIGRMRAGTSK